VADFMPEIGLFYAFFDSQKEFEASASWLSANS